MDLIFAGGLFLGLLVFSFFFIISKMNGIYFLAPMATFLTALGIVFYSFTFVRGFEAIGYIFLAGGFILVSVVGTLLLPLMTKWVIVSLWDKMALFILPIVFFTTIFAVVLNEEEYWIINEGHAVVDEKGDTYYRVSTISEGKKQIYVKFGEEYRGKKVGIKEINQNENTEIVFKVAGDKNHPEQSPFISIGMDEIKEPLTVRTTGGKELRSVLEVTSDQ
ncbi:hypothetical protein [Halobacillus halophilus]|uniref:hypothetical protein n=1 Tax=Halobacillus halophilus TaxID=1570 RepID=UPI001CD75335|nr:hypothetical protein [Halobacillus halophilus]MCA1011602.1 hypothetical protein [Halobacillus halophilus]